MRANDPADAVAAIMLGLVDPDPAVRELALDDFFGARLGHLSTGDSVPDRRTLVAAIGTLGRESTLRDDVISRLSHVSTGDSAPVIRLQALASLISLDPGTAGDDLPETLVRAVADCPHDGEVIGLVGQVLTTLGERVGLRARIVTRLLEIPERDMQSACCHWAQGLVQNWRCDEYAPMVEAVAGLLVHSEPRVRKASAGTLLNLGPVALPAADALAPLVAAGDAADPNDPWDFSIAESAVQTLAGLGDPRALPVMLDMLGRDDPPYLSDSLEGMQPLLLPHLPFLRRRMLEFAGFDEYGPQAGKIAEAIGRFGPAAAAAAGDLAAAMAGSASKLIVLQALRTIGPAAAVALPAVEGLLRDADPRIATAAAETWWCLTGDPQPALAAAWSLWDSGDEYRRHDAAELAAALGPHAMELVPQLTQMIAVDDRSGWTQAHAAVALWQITGLTQPTVSVLLDAAERNPVTLDIAVPCWAQIGPDARDALPLLHRELASPARHQCRGLSVTPVADDMAYLARCHEALASVGG